MSYKKVSSIKAEDVIQKNKCLSLGYLKKYLIINIHSIGHRALLTVITVETFEHKFIKALTKSVRTFETFGEYVDSLYYEVDKLLGTEDFIESIECTKFNPDTYGHSELQQYKQATLVFKKGTIKGTLIDGDALYVINTCDAGHKEE